MNQSQILFLLGTLFLAGCASENTSTAMACGDNEIRSGAMCIPDPARPQTDGSMPSSSGNGMIDGGLADDLSPEALPVTVDDWFYPSGYMGDGESGGISAGSCETILEDTLGPCHEFTWTPGDVGWGGVFWQHPDMNWGDEAGLIMPMGAQSVRFTAWGASGSEVVTFGAGMGDVDGFSVETGAVTLNETPTDYVIDLRSANYGVVVGAFSWSMASGDGPQTIYISHIHWSDLAPMGMPPEPTPPEPELALPLAVDDWYAPSGYMGDGSSNGIVDEPCEIRGPVEVGNCHRFTWTPGAAGWAGVFWQYPDGNWGSQDGLSIPEGALSVRFTAWGLAGGEAIEFGTGMTDVDGFGLTRNLSLTTEPTEYVLDLSTTEYTQVVGGFVWTASNSDTPVTFFVDGIHWSTEQAEVEPMQPMELGLPFSVDDHFVPSGYIGNSMAITDTPCADIVMLDQCHQFTWSPNGSPPNWGGVIWQSPDGNWGMEPGLTVAPGARAIQFTAWTDSDETTIDIGAGYGADSTDGFEVAMDALQLTDMPTEYELELSMLTYDTVASGFRWTIESVEAKTFYIANLRWVP